MCHTKVMVRAPTLAFFRTYPPIFIRKDKQ